MKSTKKKKPKKPPGRPSRFTDAVFEEICIRLSKGEPMAKICRDERMPAVSTVTLWMEKNKMVSGSIARARVEGFDALAAECLEIADETSNDVLVMETGDRPNTEYIQRSKLRIETRLKLLSKWDPKRYGDKLDVEHSGSVEIEVSIGGEDAE